MILEHFLLSVNETNCYIVACNQTREAAVIDPGEWNRQLASFVTDQKLALKWVLVTHGHTDHTGGIEEIKRNIAGVRIAAYAAFPGADRPLSEGNKLQIGKLTLKVLETPGHTQDSLAFVLGCDIFSGDALFAGSVGSTNDKQSFIQLVQSIRGKLFSLGDDMVIHPGHGPATTVQIERLFNPFFIR